jgi:hypothetical protein
MVLAPMSKALKDLPTYKGMFTEINEDNTVSSMAKKMVFAQRM